MSDFLINTGLILTYIMIGAATLAAVIYPLLFLAKNPSKGKTALMGVGSLLVIAVVSYIIASPPISFLKLYLLLSLIPVPLVTLA